MTARPSATRLKNRTGFVGSTPAEGPRAHPNRAANPGDGSIDKARQDGDDASGYTALVGEVEALEAAVSDSTPPDVLDRVRALRARVERAPLKDERPNSPFLRKGNVDSARAGAQALAAEV